MGSTLYAVVAVASGVAVLILSSTVALLWSRVNAIAVVVQTIASGGLDALVEYNARREN